MLSSNLFSIIKKTNFLKNLNYTIGASFLPKLIPYLALPILTSILTTNEMGILGYTASLISLMSIIIGFQPQNFFNVKWSILSTKEKTVYFKSYILLCLISYFILLLILMFLKNYEFFKTSTIFNTSFFLILLFIGFSISFLNFHHIVMQYENKIIRILSLNIINIVVHYITGLGLIFYFYPSWEFMIYGQFLACIFSVSIIIFSLKNYISWTSCKLSFIFFRKYLNFSYPLVFHGLGLTLMVSIDRIMIAEIVGLSHAGVYSVAYMFGYIIGIYHDALSRIWSPYFYRRINNGSKDDLHDIKIKTLFYIGSSFIIFCIFSLIAPFFYHLMVSENFISSTNIIILVALGYTFESLRKIFSGYYFYENKVFFIAGLSIFGAVTNIALNLYLIPIYNIDGAAYATLFTYILLSLTTIYFSFRNFDLKTIFLK